MTEDDKRRQFDAAVLAHLDAAYNLARWLLRDEFGAEDAVQEACLRAHRFLGERRIEHPRAWFLAVVRNACLDWLREHRRAHGDESYDDEVHGAQGGGAGGGPESEAIRASEWQRLRACIERLPRDYREVIVLRELEELSYKDISGIVDVPIGTVMSRLARARDLLSRSMRVVEKRAAR